MLRTGLIALLLLGLGSTAMASDRVRVYIGVDSYHGGVSYGLSYIGGGRDYRRWHRHHHHWDGRRGYYWRGERYYSAPRGFHYRGSRHGYSRGYYGGRHWHGRRDDHGHWHHRH